MQRPEWFDTDLFPYESRRLDIDGSTIHYVDEGEGPVLLLLHGNPTWSFLYRTIIAGLHDRFRCVALDYPGFGLSTAPDGYGFTPAEHSGVVEAFVDSLGLEDVTPMVQDWGGPIGLGWAGRRPEKVKALIIGNTWAWPTGDPMQTRFSRALGSSLGQVAILKGNIFVNRLIPAGHRRRRLSRAEMAMYRGPFPTPESRRPVAIFPEQIVGAAAYLGEVEAGLERLSDKPPLILWGTKDQAFRKDDLQRFQRTFSGARTWLLHGAGHFIQDDAGEEICLVIRDWWDSTFG